MKNFFAALTKAYCFIPILFGVILCVVINTDFFTSFTTPLSFEDVLENDYKLTEGDYVKGEIVYNFGIFCTEDTKTTKNGSTSVKKDTSRYYIIPVSDGSGNWFFIGCKAGTSKYNDMDKNSEQFWDYYNGTSSVAPTVRPELEGIIKEMKESELKRYFEESLKEMGVTSDECYKLNGKIYWLDPMNGKFAMFGGIGGIVLVLFGIIMTIVTSKKIAKKEQEKAMMYNNMEVSGAYDGVPNFGYGNGQADNMNPYATSSTDPYATPSADPYATPSTDPYATSSTDPYATPSADPYATSSADPYATPSADPYATQEGQYGYSSVQLVNAGQNKVQIIKVIRNYTGVELAEAKDYVDNAPSLILTNVSEQLAAQVKAELESYGATVTVM